MFYRRLNLFHKGEKMTAARTALAIILLALTAPAHADENKSPAVLLQEALYAEQTEGDLEKAISLYEQVLEQYKDVERLAARATYQLGMCYLKKGDKEKAAEYFDEVVGYYPEQTTVVKKAQAQLDKMGISKVKQGNIFEILGPEVCSYIGSKYGEVSAEAGAKKLYSNSHIYVVDSDFIVRLGGMGYVYNWTGKPITEHHRLTGTSLPNQKLYSMLGDEMDIEIVPDENRSNFYNIYWNPEKPLLPGEFFNYGWAIGGTKQLSTTDAGGKCSITMQNKLNQYAYETFFLAVPQRTVLSDQSEEYTGKETVNNWDIYWWKKIVQQNENHVVNVVLAKPADKADKLASENLAGEGWRLWGQRKLAEAEAKFKKAIERDPANENAYQGLGWAQLNQGKKLNAQDSFEKCIKLNPKNSAALNGLGWIAHGQGNIDQSIEWWEKAVKASNGTATASLSGLTQVYMEHKEYDKAEKYYQIWIKAEPNNKEAIGGLEKSRTLQGKPSVSEAEINSLIKQLGEKEEKPFTALNKLIDMGEPAVEQLIAKMMKKHNSNWQFPKALGGIGDKRAVEPLIEKWKHTNTSPINDVIVEALSNITGKNFGKDFEKWQQWWNEVGEFYRPEDTIRNFMTAAVELDKDRAMAFVAPDSHDYGDIKETFESSENPFNIMWRKLDSSMPTKIIKADVIDNMCSAVWRVTFKEDFNFGKTTFKEGDTFDLDGNLRKYDDKWLITGI